MRSNALNILKYYTKPLVRFTIYWEIPRYENRWRRISIILRFKWSVANNRSVAVPRRTEIHGADARIAGENAVPEKNVSEKLCNDFDQVCGG